MDQNRTIDINHAKEGMILAKDIIDSKGTPLLRADTLLDSTNIKRLVIRGIKQLAVVRIQLLSIEEISELREVSTQKLDHRFRQVGEIDTMIKLKQILLDYRLGELD